ncbi:putative peptidase [Jeotgalicoccus aerolatus]|uniref:Xaa-Pro aminopeptidase n=1 Tax=Jeotgalicoccus aerolatus TaxID=709510 RepID=A0A1G8UU91_9STAP|nr:aminopeptidase P family protein [Jeotgalicoccus aerolatus]MBP1951734.1 Xaa-Pro aminopeptidase [Jeotgalicoccus aerolatus]NMA81134.1 aminopeptidase P family protein [Jeotgalicoccus aerolatus]CAD2075429.1 putative peptidase [Jeotgalicoccus aerolatus]SDJ56510.1 Xaa-Pro aminopeptidase [Jeotgalicoccus aerolatus]GGD95217.1 Xaa-Pro dipeptidase [Jeotgalicoccus aerolatus]
MIKFDKIQQLLERESLDALLVMSAENRRYLSEFTGSSGALIITKESRFLMSDFRYKAQGAEQAEEFEFILQEKGLLESIVSFMNSKGLKRIGFEGEHVNYNTYSQLSKSFDVVPLTGEVEKIRLIKTDEELDLIIKACEIADQSYEYILTYVKAGMTELEVKNELEAHMTSLGASGPSFDTIVASGHRGALPHGVASDKVIEDGDMVTLDFGAWYKGYASDITRTFAVGSVSPEMEEIYNIVLESQLKSLDEIKAGMTGKEADSIARDVISAKGHGEHFGHSLGHGLGLEVHELPGLSQKSTMTLEPGMVITIEPGIYVDGLGGVRIEDDAVVTEKGLKKLTHSSKKLFIV